MKNILIIGSITDFGGKEIEVKNIIKALSPSYNVKLLSTFPMTEKSIVFTDIDCQWTTLHKKLNNSNIILKALSNLSKMVNKSTLPSHFLIDNKVSRFLFDFDVRSLKIIKKEINDIDAVLFCGILSSGFLKEITEYCVSTKRPILFRTTGNITEIPEKLQSILPKILSIIVHSKYNKAKLLNCTSNNIKIIDQTSILESELLKLSINKTPHLKFGYLGRFSPEKGLLELIDIFQQLNKKLIIGGNGPLLNQVNEKCKGNSFVQNIGEISSDHISAFFDKIDCLIISSFEEAGPLVGIEAMAAGKIIISTKVGAIMERLDQTTNQFWFDINNKESLLKVLSIIESKSEDEILNIRDDVRNRYLNAYSENIIASQYVKLFDQAFQNNEKLD
ncbi:glycosyltransferase family 4 protein [Flavobacterium olei]|uniref:glycosyltransferase family 4 protein n=1 Tax=Flavobacterium olei TaxID=1886782 RepID=UPI003219F31A